MKSIFEQLGGTYHEENGYLIPDLRLPAEEEQSIGTWGTAASGLSEAVPKSYMHQSSHKRQAQFLCRHRQTSAGTLLSAHRGHETCTGHNGTAKGRKRLRMDRKNPKVQIFPKIPTFEKSKLSSVNPLFKAFSDKKVWILFWLSFVKNGNKLVGTELNNSVFLILS